MISNIKEVIPLQRDIYTPIIMILRKYCLGTNLIIRQGTLNKKGQNTKLDQTE